jgi:RNA polymerase sigma-70 factor (ECF subfamily)
MTEEGYGQAYQSGFRRTVRLLCSRGASTDNAEDVAQAAWLRGWQKLDQLRDEGMIVTWINSIALNYHRRGSQDEARYQALEEPDLCGDIGIDLAPLDAAKILRLCLPRDRRLFEQQLSGLTTIEIAKNQGVSTTAIRIRFSRARRAIRAKMEGVTLSRRESPYAPNSKTFQHQTAAR